MWVNPHGIRLRNFLDWRTMVKIVVIAFFVAIYVTGMAYVILKADYREDRQSKTGVLCADKVAKMKLVPSEARIAYDLCKETDGRLP